MNKSTLANRIRASIVIPAHGRQRQLERAYASVINCKGSENAEIIVVDDCSEPPLNIRSLRPQDQIIRLKRRSGAAVGRNVGLERARGEFIYLLDSDDEFRERDFADDSTTLAKDCVHYCDILSGSRSSFPSEIPSKELLTSILFKYPHICQTSSLVFHASLGLRFDEALPKHQDWDFVLSASMLKGIPLRKCRGLVFFDRSDKSSVSRAYDASRSLPWYAKILETPELSSESKEMIRYHILGKYVAQIPWREFFLITLKLLRKRQTGVSFASRTLVHRIILALRRGCQA